ncbi:hypothetical protein [Nonlabens ulvanivorans]|uniref:hypothetical protein n=1 Tax=Nonlabens ulvanivorans TaxID=906888 RepID=UPI002943C923|nr:hypothetical protein [Nonlabens ulvanivorans]WOI21525.1 hypothetical protein R1T42_07485 [Nonlabens ulvanivorans]
MIKQTFLVILIIFLSFGKSTFPVNDKIKWHSSRPLKWSDFKGKKEVGKKRVAVAETAVEIVTENSFYRDGIPIFEINCYFLKNESWTITKDIQHLKHEQSHFNIHEVYTRKIRKEFDSLNNNKITDFDVYKSVFEKKLSECDSLNNKYDNETYFSIDKIVQVKWEKKISQMLIELNSFK